MAEPIELSGYTGSSMSWSVEGMLRTALREVEKGERNANKAIVIFLNDEDGAWDIGFSQAQLAHSEIISILETLKHYLCLEMVGYYE